MAIDLPVRAIADNTFILVQATWSVARGYEIVDYLRPTHVIVVDHATGQERYYLFTTVEFRDRLTLRPDVASIHEALNLQEAETTPLIEADTSAESAPERAVVHDGGRPIGFVDSGQPLRLQTKGVTRGEVESVPPLATLADRALTAELPQALVLDTPTSLVVFLTAAATLSSPGVPVPLPEGAVIHVVVQSRRGVTVDGDSEGTITVSGADQTRSLRFQVRGTSLGPAQLEVLVFHGTQELGSLKLTPTVVEAAAAPSAERRGREQPLAPISVRQPDLALLILERRELGGQPQLEFLVTAADPALGLSYRKFGPVILQVDPLQYFQTFFAGIEGLPLQTADDRRAADRRLASKGAQLFTDVLPPDLQTLLWSLRQRIQSIQIHSEEPWIPWELCKLTNTADGRTEEGPFLGEAFALTRRLFGAPDKPTLRLRNLAVVVPEDSGLPFAPAERQYLGSLAGDTRQVTFIEPTFLKVTDALASGMYDGWHFSGHGSFGVNDPNRSAIYLRKDDPLTPEDLNGLASNLGSADPLVFLNACQIGRAALSLTGIGGWAAQFLRAGAAAFIGTYWSVYDQPALAFAQSLYDRLLAGMPIGKAAQEARVSVKTQGDPTWMAYTVFANPMATVVQAT